MLTYTVIGTGAIGGYYGGSLANAGRTVRFLARSDFDIIRDKGLIIESVNGDFKLDSPEVYKSSADIPDSDVLLIAFKTTLNGALPDLIRPLVRKGTVLCVMQNGLGMEDELQNAFPESIVIGAMCFICSQKCGPGRICHLDYGRVTLGAYDQTGIDTALKLQSEFESSGIRTEVAESLGEARWRKLLWNIPYNGMSVVLETDTSEIMLNPASRALVREIMNEVVSASEACGYPIGVDSIDRMMKYTDTMTPYKPSMKLDYEYGRPMEIEYMYHRPVTEARKYGCSMPRTEMLAKLLTFRDNDRNINN